jgi:glycosyltransferase involved in cell wall biosynthesis
MFRTTGELCMKASPRRCHECFPDISPQQFFLRERFIKSHLSVVDRFVSPSRFLLERYVDWGIERERIVYEENGRLPAHPLPEADDGARWTRNRLGYFGQFTAFKGADVLMKAMKLLADRAEPPVVSAPPAPSLRLHGANIEHQPDEFQSLFRSLLATAEADITLVGKYRPPDLPALMRAIDWVVVPSIWWENAPLVIQEAFAHGRPVICSDIGGMAEKVTDGVNGLHFRAGDPGSLAETIARAIGTPGLWEQLRAGIPAVHPLAGHASNLSDLYDEVRAGRPGAGLPVGVGAVDAG